MGVMRERATGPGAEGAVRHRVGHSARVDEAECRVTKAIGANAGGRTGLTATPADIELAGQFATSPVRPLDPPGRCWA
jgi:hypothetical protein